jgi:hypothetical protein
MSKYLLSINKQNKNVDKDIIFFDENINKGRWFVKYYANWCGFCNQMQREWNKVKYDKIINCNIAEIESSYINKLKSPYGLRGFPEMLYYNNGKIISYNGGRDYNSIKTFINSQGGNNKNNKNNNYKNNYKNNKNNNDKNDKNNKNNNDKNNNNKGSIIMVVLLLLLLPQLFK